MFVKKLNLPNSNCNVNPILSVSHPNTNSAKSSLFRLKLSSTWKKISTNRYYYTSFPSSYLYFLISIHHIHFSSDSRIRLQIFFGQNHYLSHCFVGGINFLRITNNKLTFEIDKLSIARKMQPERGNLGVQQKILAINAFCFRTLVYVSFNSLPQVLNYKILKLPQFVKKPTPTVCFELSGSGTN